MSLLALRALKSMPLAPKNNVQKNIQKNTRKTHQKELQNGAKMNPETMKKRSQKPTSKIHEKNSNFELRGHPRNLENQAGAQEWHRFSQNRVSLPTTISRSKKSSKINQKLLKKQRSSSAATLQTSKIELALERGIDFHKIEFRSPKRFRAPKSH